MLVLLLFAGGATYWFKPWTTASNKAVMTEAVVPDTNPADSKSADARPSLAVLPFANLSDDKEQGYLADGISEDLTTELARVPGLFVVSRIAAFNYKGKDASLSQIAKELGVRYVLEGSIRRAGDDMRINAQLIDAQSGGHVWAERFDGAWGEVFTLQDKVVASVADALKLRLVTGQRMANIAGGTTNPAAYDAYLKGLELEYRDTPWDTAKAVTQYEQAIALDPNFGTAIAQLAWVYNNANGRRESGLHLSQEEINARLYKYLEAAAKNPSPNYYQIRADLLISRERKYDEAIEGLEKAIALDPSDPVSYAAMSQALTLSGRAADGLAYLEAAMRVDPTWTGWRRYLAGLAYFGTGRFADAAESLEKIDPSSSETWTKINGLEILIAAYGHLGSKNKIATARERLQPLLNRINSDRLTGLMAQAHFPFRNWNDTQRLRDGLSKAGVPELPFGLDGKSKDRLSGTEIAKITFGHETISHEIPSGRPSSSKTELDGTFTAKIGDWESGKGKAWVEGDSMCFSFPKEGRTCAVIFRNPKGTRERANEYLFFQPWNRFEFSVL